ARPLLAIAYHNFKKNNDIDNLNRTTKLLSSFWVLRRAGTGGTAGIDSRYKELYSGAALNNKLTFGFDLFENLEQISNYFTKDLATTFVGKNSNFDIVETKEAWLNKAVSVEQYKTGKQLGICRLLLLSSMHDVVASIECEWKTIKGKDGSNPTLSYYHWAEFSDSGKSQYTIEHIAPQNPKEYDWDSSLASGELTNTIGNLVILTRGDNSEASNDSWILKKNLYIELADKKYEFGVERNYNQFIKAVSASPAWQADIVLERSYNLLGNSWDNLIKWLVIQ
ncbi:HNH endonuclease family protein, partial [Shewanella sp. Isolate13]|uniref:HNH endonuclease family protein n=1 Tax=Shewanella sp. Isolate13 TaxID=2908531 RepID=UPI001EFC35B9